MHLVVLCHGLWGVTDNFNYLEKALRAATDNSVVFYRANTNEKFRTYDGIDLCGTRVAEEIMQEVRRLRSVTKLSVIGYSLGGLVARYAVGVLEYKGFFERVRPVNFTTFCSPHVGVPTVGDSFSVRGFNWLAPKLLGRSGRQMFLNDSAVKDTPLLLLMARPDSTFYRGLKRFEHLSLYGNMRSDLRTSWWTAGISYVNPFEVLDNDPSVKIDKDGNMRVGGSLVKFEFVDGYAPVVLDADRQVEIVGKDYYQSQKGDLGRMIQEDMPEDNAANGGSSATSTAIPGLKWLMILYRSIIYLPVWFVWFVLSSIVHVSNSSIRIIRESSKMKKYSQLYSVQNQFVTFDNDMRDQGDYFLNSVFDAVTSPRTDTQSVFSDDGSTANCTTTVNQLCSTPADEDNLFNALRINLFKEQREIIKNLNQLNWKKYPIYITLTNATHAAAIVRHEDPTFKEGQLVVRHYCEEVFVE